MKYMNSIATKLFRIVFSIYLIVTFFLTIGQMYSEYKHVEEEVTKELGTLARTSVPGLARMLWEVDYSEIDSIPSVLAKLPIIEKIEIADEKGNIVGRYNWRDSFDSLHSFEKTEIEKAIHYFTRSYKYEFDIVYVPENILVGRGIFYSNAKVVFERVRYGFLLIFVSAVIKTFALWTIFILVSRKILSQPMNRLVASIKSINQDNLEHKRIDLKRRVSDELSLVEDTLNEMILGLFNAQTKNHQYAEDLKRKNIELNELDRLKDDFLTNTSHELRTPLHSIIAITQLLKDGLRSDEQEEVMLNLNLIMTSAKRLTLLIDDILDLSKLKHNTLRLQLKPVDILAAIQVVIQLSAPLIRNKELQIICNTPETISMVHADENRLYQILYNLLGNAIKFTEKGDIAIEAKQVGKKVEILIADSAETIHPSKFETIFTSFQQLDGSISRTYEGMGLGLAITKQLIELHSGEIKVKNRPGRGNIFTFTIPLSEQVDLPKPDTKPSDQFNTTLVTPQLFQIHDQQIEKESFFKILAVDDDTINLHIIMNYLANFNYNVICVQSGAEALEWLDKNDKPDLVLLDIMMPQISGFDVCRSIRQRYDIGTLPVVFLTASHRRKDIEIGFSLGANDYLTKPFEKSELLSRIRVHLQLLLAKKQLQSLRDYANQISDFKEYDEMIDFSLKKMIEINFVTDTVLFTEDGICKTAEKKWDFLNHRPDAKILKSYEMSEEREILIVNSLDNDDALLMNYQTVDPALLKGTHFAFIRLANIPGYLICLFRKKERLPFSAIDQEYISTMINQINTTEGNIQKMLSKDLIKVLPEIQPNLGRITHISKESPYCLVYYENRSEPVDVRISLSSIDLYFSDQYLLRVHKSHLINPQKIMLIKKVTVGTRRYGYDIIVGTNKNQYRIRIGGSYVAMVKRIFPDYFNDK